ncbi:uncharacterized protein [Physcomitrium patens]|uniref:Uncharacterized protein n=1 Tax=Physcomitrium patens TaxID=3218 RepID=A0A7I4B6M5_PHYPA|nr:multidrug resistance-associated protein 4-like isoform X3 [Physcomitrium patens]|eukprot:XP_024398184.1 multidrug resistance-associated protein 4-like isoform X3 [Physcomitrella patens]
MLRKMVSVEGSKRNTEMSKEEEVQEFETGGMSTGKPCPLSNASIFSFLTWQWVQPLITIGNKKTLEAEDLWDLVPDETSVYCERSWLKAVEGEKMKKNVDGSPVSVWKLMYKSMGYKFMLGGLYKPVWLLAVVLQVYILKALVKIAQGTERLQWWWAALLVVGMFLTSTTQSITQHQCFTIGQRTGMKARATVAMAVFNKIQEMSLASLSNTNTGIMLNLVTNDTQKILDAATFFHFVWFALVEVAVVGGLVIYEAGVAAIPGVMVTFLTQPLQVKVAQRVGWLRRSAIDYTDSRVRSVNEVLTGVRVVKYNGWTAAFLKRIGDLRSSEMHWIKRANFLRASTSTLRDGVIPLASFATFGTFVAVHGGAALTPSLAFTVLALFSILVRLFSIAPLGVQYLSEAMVAMQRFQQLLDLPNGHGITNPDEQDKTCDDKRSKKAKRRKTKQEKDNGLHILSRVPRGKDSDKVFEEADTLKGVTFEVQRGDLVAIVGAVGSGKSSLLLALLGEMECLAGESQIDRPAAFAPQQPWILNDTIRSNVLFGNKFDEFRYKETVSACALDHDIAQLPAGHDTEIGERGVNLSGGQNARISLARACYSTSPLLLLDDPLAAVDVPTAKHLMDHVLCGILKGRTVILVTHNKTSLSCCDKIYLLEHERLQELSKEALLDGQLDEVILNDTEDNGGDIDHKTRASLGRDDSSEESGGENGPEVDVLNGASAEMVAESSQSHLQNGLECKELTENGVSKNGPSEEPVSDDVEIVASVFQEVGEEGVFDGKQDEASIRKSFRRRSGRVTGVESDIDGDKGGKLTVKEDRAEGEVTWATYIQYAKDGGGRVFIFMVVVIFLFAQAVRVMLDYWLSVWVDRKYQLSTRIYVISYACFAAGAIALSLTRALLFMEAAMLSAKKMHGRMAEKVLRSPQLFFDQNPVGRIVNRFSKDQSLVDELLPSTAQTCMENFTGCLGSIAIIAVLIPWFLLAIPPFIIIFLILQKRYVTVSRELKRLDGLSRSPMYAHLSQTLQGIASVRAFGAQKRMHDRFLAMIDANHRAFILFVHSSRWLGVRLDLATSMAVATASLLVVLLRNSISPGLAGVVLVQSLQLTGFFQYGVRLAAETENYFTSVERIQAYTELPTEADSDTAPGVITEKWPEKGEIEFVHYTMAYREDLPRVLNDLCFKVNSQEKVGILGRTGAGKSSLAAAMFRLVENKACSGRILIDDIDIAHIGLDDLRRRLSIIPQDPVLFRGTVRLNLDPFEQHTDFEIIEAIANVHLSKKIESLDKGIDSVVAENGENFSVGQRQLLCLARSLLRRSRVIVMDEATAAVDGETDQLIQTAMRSVFHTCTVLTIAHRIETIIDCDRVLVLAKGGRLAEFDTPANLLRRAELIIRDGSEGRGVGNYGFAVMVAQSGEVIAKRLREAAEAAELRRQQESS